VIDRLVADYGFRERLVGIDHLHPPLTELDLDKGFSGSAELLERFRANSRQLIAKGADVLIPAEGVLNTLMVRNALEEVDGVPVLDSYGAVLAMAEMLVHHAVNANVADPISGGQAALAALTGAPLRS
jgi:allantoin racemase